MRLCDLGVSDKWWRLIQIDLKFRVIANRLVDDGQHIVIETVKDGFIKYRKKDNEWYEEVEEVLPEPEWLYEWLVLDHKLGVFMPIIATDSIIHDKYFNGHKTGRKFHPETKKEVKE